MAVRTGRRTQWVVQVAATVLLLALGFVIACGLRSAKLETVAAWAQVASVPIALLPQAPVLIRLLTGRRRRTSSTPMQLDSEREVLAVAVRQQWRDEILMRRLDDPAPLAVHWRQGRGAVTDAPANAGRNPWVRFRSGRFRGGTERVPELALWFTRLPRRRLVILGPVGMGKTTLAILLVRELLAEQYRGGGLPVPVLFSMSGWNPAEESLRDWLIREITEGHLALSAPEFGASAVRDLVDQSKVMPVFDGLDELPPDVRSLALDRINASMAADGAYILTSRSAEYEDAVRAVHGDVLTAATVIEAMPITRSNGARYLERCRPPASAAAWRTLLTTIRRRPEAPLSMALDSPLAFWLLRKVYVGRARDPRELLDHRRFPDAAAIVDAIVPAGTGRSSARRVSLTLSFLARHLRDARTSDLAWWEFRRTLTIHQMGCGLALAGVAGAASFGLAVGVGLELSASTVLWMISGIITGIAVTFPAHIAGLRHPRRRIGWRSALAIAGAACALAAAAATVSGASALSTFLVSLLLGILSAAEALTIPHEPAHASFKVNARFRQLGIRLLSALWWGSVVGGVLWLVIGAVLSVQRGFERGVTGGAAFGFTAGMGLGLASALTDWESTPLPRERVQAPALSLRRDIELLLIRSAAFGLVFGVAFAVVSGPWRGLAAGLLVAIAALLAGGPIYRTCGMYLITVGMQGVRGNLPFRTMAFLQDAHRLGLLRQVGQVYQFRHVELQRHFVRGRGVR